MSRLLRRILSWWRGEQYMAPAYLTRLLLADEEPERRRLHRPEPQRSATTAYRYPYPGRER